MPRVADYSIVADAWTVEGVKDTIEFTVGSNLDTGSRAVLGFMLEVSNLEKVGLTIRINGHSVWNWSYPPSTDHLVRFFQEVIAKDVLVPGTNVFSFDSSSGDKRYVALSDVVVWWQANL